MTEDDGPYLPEIGAHSLENIRLHDYYPRRGRMRARRDRGDRDAARVRSRPTRPTFPERYAAVTASQPLRGARSSA